jgi:ADP-ribose pyrophosphatase YjhB (NUDIX family)
MPEKLHCTYCGAAFAQQAGWPRTCTACGRITYRNPLPVVVVLLPVSGGGGGDRDGLLVVRRGVKADPGFGQLALPGGYVDINDPSWQHAAARELREETGIELPPGAFAEYRVRSAPNGTLLVFALATSPVPPSALSAFRGGGGEVGEIDVITSPRELAFELHTDAARHWFESRPGGTAPVD